MKIAVISDLHLGRGDSADRFGHDETEFLRFLKWLEGSFDRVVLLGDVWETLTNPFPWRAGRELKAAREAHPEIARRFERPAYRYVHGNHDQVAAALVRAPGELILHADGVRVLFTHGHLYDWIIRSARLFSELGAWMGGWVLRLGLSSAFETLVRWDARVRGAVPEAMAGFQRWALELATLREMDVVVTGHTHLGGVLEQGGRVYLNSGHISGGRYEFLHLDTRTGVFGLERTW